VSVTRAELVARGHAKIAAPFTLDEDMTFLCPQENLEAMDLPVVRRFHRWISERRPETGPEPAVLLLLPCEMRKPYTLSDEHLAVNGALIAAGYLPSGRGDWPDDLAAHAPAELLSNAPLVGNGLRIDRAVISEPFGIVPYEAVYRWRGRPSPCSRYDDPGLFEHRGIHCWWRRDCTTVPGPRGARWGDSERAAYVEVHNRLARLMGETLEAWAPAYRRILAYVAPRMTHRSFLDDVAGRRRARIPGARLAGGRRMPLRGVADDWPGLVTLVPASGTWPGRTGRLTDPDCLRMLVAAVEAEQSDHDPQPIRH